MTVVIRTKSGKPTVRHGCYSRHSYDGFILECAREGLGIDTSGKTVEEVRRECIERCPDIYSPPDDVFPCLRAAMEGTGTPKWVDVYEEVVKASSRINATVESMCWKILRFDGVLSLEDYPMLPCRPWFPESPERYLKDIALQVITKKRKRK